MRRERSRSNEYRGRGNDSYGDRRDNQYDNRRDDRRDDSRYNDRREEKKNLANQDVRRDIRDSQGASRDSYARPVSDSRSTWGNQDIRMQEPMIEGGEDSNKIEILGRRCRRG